MRNDFCYSLKIIIFPILSLLISLLKFFILGTAVPDYAEYDDSAAAAGDYAGPGNS